MRKETLAPGVVVYCGDCAEILSGLRPSHALVTDPPYGIGAKMKTQDGNKHWPAELYADMSVWDKAPPAASLLDLARSKAEHAILWGGNYFNLPPSRCWLVWSKPNAMPTVADCELAWTSMDRNVKRFEHSCNGWDRKHPTQKPVELMAWCLQQLPKGVTRILDPFMGSGTTGVAAIGLGMQFTGIEREEKYFDYACERLREAIAAPRQMFEQPRADDAGSAEATQPEIGMTPGAGAPLGLEGMAAGVGGLASLPLFGGLPRGEHLPWIAYQPPSLFGLPLLVDCAYSPPWPSDLLRFASAGTGRPAQPVQDARDGDPGPVYAGGLF